MKIISESLVRSHLKKRDDKSHKGSHGHALLIAGHQGSMGAAVIAAKASLRAGLGLLTVNVPNEERFILQIAVPEAMLAMRDGACKCDYKKYSVIGIGPGLGTDNSSLDLLHDVLHTASAPLLMDADALNLVSQNIELLHKIPEGTVITPHVAEFDRLFGKHDNREDRIRTAINKAKQHNLIIVLKDYRTIVLSSDEVYCNVNGNSGLAKGGSGDALSGIITAFLAQGYKPFYAAIIGVYLHGLAADITLFDQSKESMLITDVIANLGKAFLKVMD